MNTIGPRIRWRPHGNLSTIAAITSDAHTIGPLAGPAIAHQPNSANTAMLAHAPKPMEIVIDAPERGPAALMPAPSERCGSRAMLTVNATMNVSIAIPAAVEAGKGETPIPTQATKTIATIETDTNRTTAITDPLIRSTDLGTVSEQRRD